VAEASEAWMRDRARDALRDWSRDLDRREQLDAASIELAAERRRRASGGAGQQPALAASPPALASAPAPAHHRPLSFPLPDRPQPVTAPAPMVSLWPAPAPAAAAAAPAPAAAGRVLIRTPRERWRNARGHWSDEVLAEANRLLSPSGGNHAEDKVAKALGIKRQSLQEALRRWTARSDKGKAAATA
jgi:hypothetical protein